MKFESKCNFIIIATSELELADMERLKGGEGVGEWEIWIYNANFEFSERSLYHEFPMPTPDRTT